MGGAILIALCVLLLFIHLCVCVSCLHNYYNLCYSWSVICPMCVVVPRGKKW